MIDRIKIKIISILLKSLKKYPNNWQYFLRILQNSVGSHNTLKDCLEMDQALYLWTTIEASRQPGGHPKHKYLRYFDWFASHLESNDSVLDVGCGKGELTSILASKTSSIVTGIEIDGEKVKHCKNEYAQDNLKFIQGDVMQFDSAQLNGCDVVTLSNVLEHIDERGKLLTALKNLNLKRLLVRVPQFDRDWRVPVKRDLEIDFFLDPTHVLEYTYDQLENELKENGFKIIEARFNWGEIWVVSEPL